MPLVDRSASRPQLSVMVGEGSFRSILCAVDLAADAPVIEAHRMAGGADIGPTLTFLHVVPDDFPGAPMSPAGATQAVIDRERLGRTVGDALEARVARLTGRDASSSRFEIEGGVPSQVIVSRAQELSTDLVVLGHSSKEGPERPALGQALLGRTASTVVREAPCSVLVVRQGASPRPGTRVLAAVDLLEGTAQVVRIAAVQAARLGAGLTLLHSLDPIRPVTLGDPGIGVPLVVPGEASDDLVRSAQDRLRELVARIELPAETLVVEEPASAAILRTAEALGASLLIVGTRAKEGLARLVLGSVAQEVVTRAPCNVLVVRQSFPPK
jgi:nucleotide-binding universal stress UspA family protein